MTISKGRGIHVKLIVLLRQSDFYCSGHQAGPSMNICCWVRRPWRMKRAWKKDKRNYRPLPLFSTCLRRKRGIGKRASGRGRHTGRTQPPPLHSPTSLIPRSHKRANATRIVRERPEAEERGRRTCGTQDGSTRECVECVARDTIFVRLTFSTIKRNTKKKAKKK